MVEMIIMIFYAWRKPATIGERVSDRHHQYPFHHQRCQGLHLSLITHQKSGISTSPWKAELTEESLLWLYLSSFMQSNPSDASAQLLSIFFLPTVSHPTSYIISPALKNLIVSLSLSHIPWTLRSVLFLFLPSSPSLRLSLSWLTFGVVWLRFPLCPSWLI